jgi:hypothetical protein
MREKAVTMGRIAEILQVRGQINEAIQRACEAREVFVHLQDPAGIAYCDELLLRIEATRPGDAA